MASTETTTPAAGMPTTAPVAAAPIAATPPAPAASQPVVAYKDANPEAKARIDKALGELNIKDSNSIIFFGARAQEQLTTISENMLEGVRNKDTGPAGAALGEMLSKLRGFKVDDLDPNNKPGFFGRLLGSANPIAKFVQQYEDVRKQIDTVSNRLDTHKNKLMEDIVKLDKLYDANLAYYHTLAEYIAAGEEMLRRLDGEVIPAMAKAAEGADMLKSQELRDMRSMRDDLERRVHDLKLTRQVAMQSLPSIRLVQENDKSLVTKINSTMANTIPLWKQQLAQAVTIYRASEAAKTVKEATDLTNELLKKNADMLRDANAATRTEVERGIVDIEAVKHAHAQLIATIEDSLKIADEGKKKRAEAEKELVHLEDSLKSSLQQASARAQGLAPPAPAPAKP
ncbi:MAG: toxic anion resistance protein [Candidatus Odyssella sp.]|nr:toxic anion resistance protein [Candidatus Odyssella sp.]